VVSGYLFAFVRSAAFIDYLVGRTTGANYPAVNDGEVKAVPMPVPPLAEQERVVKLLDEADELRKLRAQADRRTAALIPALFHEMFGDPARNEKHWSVKSLPEVAFFQEGPGVRKWQFRSTGIKLINVGNIVDGQLDLSKTDRHLDKEEVEKTYSHFLLNAGDLVMATSGVTWGKVAFIDTNHLPLCMNTSVVRFRPLESNACNPIFLRAFLETQAFRHQIEKLITGSAQPNFGPSHLKLIRLPFPPLLLQKEFAQRVTEIRGLEAAQAASRQRLEALFQSMLHRAFNGEF
jgi:restriction endonuclease S subunit